MTSRPPATPLRSSLRAVHARIRRALVLRHALRASAAASVLLAFAVTAGLALPRTQATAGVRLALFAAGALRSLVLAALAMLRDTPRWAGWLESLEGRFAGLRSWLRNALDLEASPGSHTSGELAQAVRSEAEQRLKATPLAETVPPLAARAPLTAVSAALLSLTAAVVFAPAPTLDAWHTLWSPGSAAPAIELRVERSEEHTSELQSHSFISYAVFCLKKKNMHTHTGTGDQGGAQRSVGSGCCAA